MHVTPSDSRAANKNKVKIAIRKLEFELESTLLWEESWKIKTSLNKCSVLYSGTTRSMVENYAGVIVRDTLLPIAEPLKILGYHLHPHLFESCHINSISHRAKSELSKLYRFQTAPEFIKKRLYLTLIRPILEYPCLEVHSASLSLLRKLQVVQNKALRFITNTTWRDFVSSEALHLRLKLDPMNIRLFSLAYKTQFKMRDMYYLSNDPPYMPYHKLIKDYTLSGPTYRQRGPSLLEILETEIYSLHGNRSLKIHSLPQSIDDIPASPDPIY